MSAAPKIYDVQLRGCVVICHNTIHLRTLPRAHSSPFSPSSFVDLRKLNMDDYLPEASNLLSSDTQVPVRDTCEDEDQDEDEMLRRAIALSLTNDDAQVCEPRPESNVESYQYSPLPSTDKTIRLLCIPPADHISDPLVCQMRQVRLNDQPEYAALSYT